LSFLYPEGYIAIFMQLFYPLLNAQGHCYMIFHWKIVQQQSSLNYYFAPSSWCELASCTRRQYFRIKIQSWKVKKLPYLHKTSEIFWYVHVTAVFCIEMQAFFVACPYIISLNPIT